MADPADLVRIQQAHHASLLAVRDTSAGLIGDAWDAYAGLDDASALRFRTAAAEISTAAQQRTSALAAGYLEANDAVLGHASTLTPRLPPIRNGIPATDVYQRSIVEARTVADRGAPVDQALAAGRARAQSTARTDVILANRSSVSAQADGRPWVVGYRRILTGKSCPLCATASTQRYNIADLQPIHPNCDCDVGEIYGDTDPGQVINQELLDDIKDAHREAGGPGNYWDGPYIVDDSGIIRYRKIENLLDADGQIVRNAQGNPVRVARPGDVVKPKVQAHGELGQVLTDRRHVFTAADDLADVEVPAPALRRPPAPAAAADDLARTPAAIADEARAAAPKSRIKPTDPSSPSVIREAQRRNMSPERVAAERDAAKLRRAQERRAEREARKSLSVDHPDVIRVAQREGISPDEVIAALERVPVVRKEIADAAARVQADAFDTLYSYRNADKIRRPPPAGARSPDGRLLRGGEYDFLEQLDARERARLSRSWYSDSPVHAPDLLAQTIGNANPQYADDAGKAIAHWLDLTRRYEAAGAVRRGKLPSERAYSGRIDVDTLVDSRYSVRRVLGADDLDAAAHLARVDRADLADDAYRFLGPATNPQHGPSPYRMSFQAWEDEVRSLEYGLREYPADMPRSARARLAELVPEWIDEPGTSYEDLYTRIVATARQAGEEVPSYARIPWE